MDMVRVSVINASESATIRCFCRHLDYRDLLDYSPRTIGA